MDRKARNTDLNVNWISNGTNGTTDEYVVLKWEIPIDVRRFTLYDILPNSSNNTNIHVTDCELFLYWDNNIVKHISSTGPLNTEGLEVSVSPITTIDSVKIIVKSFSGLINNISSAGLAEVEVNSRVSSYDLVGINDPVAITNDYRLDQNYPNPFNPSTIIRFTLPKAQSVTLEVFDISGRNVATLISGRVEGGNNSIKFNPSNLSSGIYFYKLTADNFTQTRKMLFVK